MSANSSQVVSVLLAHGLYLSSKVLKYPESKSIPKFLRNRIFLHKYLLFFSEPDIVLKAKAQKSITFLPLKVLHEVHRAGERLEKMLGVYCFFTVFEDLFIRGFWLFCFLSVFMKMSLLKRQLVSLAGEKLAHVLG